MKKSKFFKTLAVFGACLSAPFLLSGCEAGDNNFLEFRVQDGYVQYTKDGSTWENIISTDDLKGEDGEDGNGIKSITIDQAKSDSTKTTYIITFDDDTTYSFEVKNGTNGNNGTDGKDGKDGTDGEDGNGIKSITIDQAKSDSTKTTYIITFDDDTTYSFEVKNGTNGNNGADGEDGKDAAIDTYTITYDYGVADTLFDQVKETETIKATQWLMSLPKINDEYKDSFLGWFISGTEKQIKNYDFIGGDVTLEARFDVNLAEAGIYSTNGKYLKTWQKMIDDEDVEVIDGKLNSNNDDLSGVIVINNDVTSIGASAFNSRWGLLGVVIPNSVESIESSAFEYCQNLNFVRISKSVTEIDLTAFKNSPNITNFIVDENNTVYDSRNNCNALIETSSNTLIKGFNCSKIPNDVTKIGDSAFAETNIESIVIPAGVEVIESSAFEYCQQLKSITIAATVTTIGNRAFLGCNALEGICIPKNVISIGEGVLYECSSLKSIVVEEGNTKYDSRNNCNALIETETKTLIKGCESSFIPNGVEIIAANVFDYCVFNSLLIPSSVKTIMPGAFAGAEIYDAIMIDSEHISNTLIDEFSYDGSLYVSNIYIKEELPVENSTWLLDHYTIFEYGGIEGYVCYQA